MTDLLTRKPASANVTDLKALLLAQKTELIGELTRAIANHFNNTMMAVTSYAELEMKRVPPTQRRSLEQILNNAARATALVQQLLGISRNHAGSPESLNLNSLLTETKYLIEQLSGESMSVTYGLDPAIPAISADPTDIQQLVLSLAINARNAKAEGGTLTITTRSVVLTADSIGETDRPGEYVVLSIDDADVAGTEHDLASRSVDQDSRVNMSLVMVRSVVKSANGIVRFSTEPGKGSSFKIYFPALRQNAGAASERTVVRKVAIARAILIVEDDDAVRVPTSELLKMEGFKVLQARTGEEAIQVVQQNRPSLDVLITDVVMPGMSGHDVAGKLLELYPGLRVLYMSGDTQNPPSSLNTEQTRAAILRKPFRLEILKDKIHELLGE